MSWRQGRFCDHHKRANLPCPRPTGGPNPGQRIAPPKAGAVSRAKQPAPGMHPCVSIGQRRSTRDARFAKERRGQRGDEGGEDGAERGHLSDGVGVDAFEAGPPCAPESASSPGGTGCARTSSATRRPPSPLADPSAPVARIRLSGQSRVRIEEVVRETDQPLDADALQGMPGAAACAASSPPVT